MSDRRARQLRDALTLLASLGLVLSALIANRGRQVVAPPAMVETASAPSVPPPLPLGGQPPSTATAEPESEAGCSFAEQGFGAYERWRPLPLGQLLVPPASALRADGGYDLLIHFHGAEPVRKLLAPRGFELVIAGVDAGTRSSHYARATTKDAWEALLQAIDRAVADATGVGVARARHLALSSWSAGSGAISRVLDRGSARIDALILLDSLYGSYASGHPSLVPGQLAAFIDLANAAARGGPLFYLTHTDVPTSGYASTGETASFLLRELGASPIAVTSLEGAGATPAGAEVQGAGGLGERLRLTRMYDGGSLYVRGYAGTSADDHCAQLRLLPSILAEHVLPSFSR